MVLVGHVVPKLSIASLIGIRVLCDTGCEVVFTKTNCDIWYKGKVILSGTKEPSTDLWTLPIGPQNEQAKKTIVNNKCVPTALRKVGQAPQKSIKVPSDAHYGATHAASFAHSVKTRANAVKFAHQALCNPKISTLLKAVRRGFLDGCPNLSEKLINKYLNASPATAKGHMKRPRHGIRSTTPKQVLPTGILQIGDVAQNIPHIHPPRPPVVQAPTIPNLIGHDKDDYSIANIFGFGAFADKQSGVMYNDLTGNFPFMSLDGSV